MKIEINKENRKVQLLENDGTLILEGTWKEIENKLKEKVKENDYNE